MDKELFVYIICMSVISSGLLAIGFYGGLTFNEHKTSIESFLLKQNDNCSGLSLSDTVKCLNNEVKEWFVYNDSNTYKNLTEEEFKAEGGVCWQASNYYKQRAENLGYYGTTCTMDVYIDLNGTLHRHEIAIISNFEGYSIADQNDIVGYGYLDVNKSMVKK